ncbi:ABC transporter ATP-binding protein [Actinomadura harenae]|uniref:ABC transporter ATP-binding protein n=1 Tax=Actinomadura harenae TaxID=2483351 RepID=UPI0013154601|nr:ATP-binding cassette domain-containing protein [Actinomadura harenae]
MNALTLKALTIDVPGRRVVDGLDLTVPRGRVVALAGPSGSGKSLTARSVVGLNREGVRAGGAIMLGETDLLTLPERELRAVRGRRVGYAFQDAVASLNPTITIGRHLTETVRAHRAAADGRDALRRCGLDPDAVWHARPYELSGGQAQRAALALATVLGPDLLIADEVTTALDPVTQAEVLDAVRAQARDEDRAVLLITHDLAVAARWADEIAVITEGRVVEQGPPGTVLGEPRHPFTRALASAARLEPSAREPGERGETAVSLRGVRRVLGGRARTTVALDGVDLDVREGEAVAVVGRSGSGKSTLVGVLAALDRPQDGRVLAGGPDARARNARSLRGPDVRSLGGPDARSLRGSDVWALRGSDVWSLRDRDRRALRRRTGLVFQDALASFDPRHTVRQVIAEAGATAADVDALLTRVGLDPALAGRMPRTLSGGERQRVALARALASRPRVLLADEPTTGLDVIAQERVLALLDELRRDEGLAIVFVTHDLRVARRVADRVVVLAGGRVVDDLPAAALDSAALDSGAVSPETAALLASTPSLRLPTS